LQDAEQRHVLILVRPRSVLLQASRTNMRVQRQRWAEELLKLRDLIESPGTPDKELLNALRLLHPQRFPVSKNACGVPRGDMCLACDDEEQIEIERGLRRVTGGRYSAPVGKAKCIAQDCGTTLAAGGRTRSRSSGCVGTNDREEAHGGDDGEHPRNGEGACVGT
jgi:hypothetical protein